MRPSRGKLPSLREAFALLLLVLPLLVTVSVIEAADWVKGLPSLKAIVLVSVPLWGLLARTSVPWWASHPLALLAGLAVAFLLGAVTLSESRGLSDLGSNLSSWFGAIGTQEGDRGASITGVGLIAVVLWSGYVSVWLAYRRSSAILSALPGVGVLLVVLTFLPSSYYWYTFMYLIAAAPGIAYRHRGQWTAPGRAVPMVGTLLAALVIMGVTLAAVWRIPAPEGVVIPLASAFEGPWHEFRGAWSDLFYGVPNRKQSPFFSPSLEVGMLGPWRLPKNETLFVVKSQEPHRWRMRVYETYTGRGWVQAGPPIGTPSTEAPLDEYVEELDSRKEVRIAVRMRSKGHALVSVGEPMYTSIPSKADLSPPAKFRLYYAEDSQVSYLPESVKEYSDRVGPPPSSSPEIGALQPSSAGSRTDLTNPRLQARFAAGLSEIGFKRSYGAEFRPDWSGKLPRQSDNPYIVLERVDPSSGPALALVGERVLVPHKSYTTAGSLSDAPPAMLRQAGGDYPDWVTDRYLQLPNEFPETVRKLARELTRDEESAYEMVASIRRFLGTMPYTLDVSIPPPGQDWVEFFLLVQKRGYCQNYASAMITMLRSLGIPARLVVGFAPGIWDEDRGVWEVQSKHYHAWPEVYFPSYGWVEFEPTPADVQPALEPLGVPNRQALVGDSGVFDPCIDAFLLDLPGLCEEEFTPRGDDLDLLDAPANPVDDPLAASPGSGGSPISSPWTWLGLGLGLVLALAAPAGTVAYARRGLFRLGYPTVAYAFMCFLGRLAGTGPRPQETPWEYGARLGDALPEHREAVSRVTQGFVAARYDPSKQVDHRETEGVRAAWLSLRGPLLRRMLRRLVPRRRRGDDVSWVD